MLKSLIAAATAVTLISGAGMSGTGFAQSSYSSSTTESTQVTPPRHDVDVTETTRRTENRNGVLIEKDTVGSETLTPGAAATTEQKTTTTTIR